MPVIQRKGAQSSQGFGEFAQSSTAANYIEDVFSTYLYQGNNSTQTITNGIDLSTKGGLVWSKSRASSIDHALYDTARGNKFLSSNTTSAQSNPSISGMSFTTTGYNLLNADGNLNNTSFSPYVSWTFRKQPKFFDVVTYTGNGTSQNIAHNLGSTPGCVMIKRTDSTSDWVVWHRSLSLTSTTQGLRLNSSDAFGTPAGGGVVWSSTSPMTSTTFGVGASQAGNWNTNLDTATYVAYLFAHDAGGFGSAGTDNVISCGSYTGTGAAGKQITLGYEAQWVLIKNTTAGGNGWILVDNMRGGLSETTYAYLLPNLSAAEVAGGGASLVCATATGFRVDATGSAFNSSGDTFIYIAIRRGPMKTPTSGTSVFSPVTQSTTGNSFVTSGFPVDFSLLRIRDGSTFTRDFDRLRGKNNYLRTSSTISETIDVSTVYTDDYNNGIYENVFTDGFSAIYWMFRRAPGFFDVVCYTGTGSATTQTHNLGVAPELIIVKRRNTTGAWAVYSSALSNTEYAVLNTTAAKATGTTYWNSTTPTSSVFSIGTATDVNASGSTYVAYLFASVAGVSKVGSYTGTGALQTVNCGFTSGARFVLIKRTDSTGDWYVWDSARGISSGNDPYLLLNSTAAEVTGTNYVDTDTTGFKVTAAAPADINANGGNFIFLAVA